MYCIGDASALQSGLLPATAQVAAQEAKHLAKHLNSQVVSWRSDPGEFKVSLTDSRRATLASFLSVLTRLVAQFSSKGIMTYIGGWQALVDRSKVEEGPKGEMSGRVAWLRWRSGKRPTARAQHQSTC